MYEWERRRSFECVRGIAKAKEGENVRRKARQPWEHTPGSLDRWRGYFHHLGRFRHWPDDASHRVYAIIQGERRANDR